jgi:uncharacterized Zn finger protein
VATILVSEESVRQLADPSDYQRGQDQFSGGMVHGLAVEGTVVRAMVDGHHRVRLDLTRSGLAGECDCPHGDFCEHCVAVALAWLDTDGTSEDADPAFAPDDDLRAFLADQDPTWLADELLRAAEADPALRARLEDAAAEVYED